MLTGLISSSAFLLNPYTPSFDSPLTSFRFFFVVLCAFARYVLGGFEKRVEEKYIRPLVPYRSSTPSSVGPSGAATPSSNGAVARGTPSPPAGPSDEVSPEELLSAAGIGPHWLPPLAERRVPLWDETEGLVIIAQNAPKVSCNISVLSLLICLS